MPKIDIAAVPARKGSGYPAPFAGPCAERNRKRLGNADSRPVVAQQINDAMCVNGGQVLFYSTTFSALASSVVGTARPSALAVLRLIDNSNLET